MNKKELIQSITSLSGLSQSDVEKALNGLVVSVCDALSRGEEVQLVGFGTFSVLERGERTGRKPKTGEPVQIAAGRVPKFKAGKALKDAVNG